MITPRTHIGLLGWTLMLALGAECFAQHTGGDIPGSTGVQPKPVSLATAIGVIKREVTVATRVRDAGLRLVSDFAQDKNWSLPADDVLRGLSRRLHKDPATDAYVKWQLLSFVSELPDADNAEYERVADRVPKLTPRMHTAEAQRVCTELIGVSGPNRSFFANVRQTAYVSNLRPVVGTGAVGVSPEIGVVSSGTVLDGEVSTKSYITVCQTVTRQIEDRRARAGIENRFVLAFRDALNEKAPRTGGLRLALMFRDVRDRIVAGDPSAPDALSQVVAAAQDSSDDLPPNVRTALIGWCDDLRDLRVSLAESVEPAENNKLTILYSVWAAAEDDIDSIRDQLAGVTEAEPSRRSR